MLGPITPHVVIDGRPQLTQWIWDQCPQKPIILTSQPLSSQIYRDDIRANDRPSNVYCFFGMLCIPEVRELFPEFDCIKQLQSIFEDARARFGLPRSDDLNIVAAGSHGSLWTHEHTSVGRLANPFEFRSERGAKGPVSLIDAAESERREAEAMKRDATEDRSLKALKLLRRSAENRQFVGHIAKTLDDIGGVKLRWLRECFPGLGALETSDNPALRETAQYCRRFMGEPYGVGLGGALPQVYVRQGERYKLATRYDRHDRIDQFRAPTNPLRTTYLLLQQFDVLRQQDQEDSRFRSTPHDGGVAEQRVAIFDPESWSDAILTKLIPRKLVRGNLNPLDNPIIGENQYAAAATAGISAILIDDERGVLDLHDTFRRIEATIGSSPRVLTIEQAEPILKKLIGLAAVAIRESAALMEYEEQSKLELAPDQAHKQRANEVLKSLFAITHAILTQGTFSALQDAEDTRIVSANKELRIFLESLQKTLATLLDFKAPPTLTVGPVIRDLWTVTLGARMLIEHLSRLFPSLAGPMEPAIEQIRLGDLAAELLPPRIYRM